VYSQFEADTCSIALGLPTCAEWVPDPHAFLKLLTHQAPPFIGAWCMIGLICATMSTADGAILALGTVFSNNIFRQLDVFWPNLVTPENLLLTARVSTLPLTLISTMIAAYYRSSDKQTLNSTGSLLIVAFDVMLATCVVPLFGAFYAKNPSPRAALVSMIGGASTRLVLEFTLPKDGSMVLPYDNVEYLDYGTAASVKLPSFIDANATDIWDPSTEQCAQESFSDFTGLDSLTAFFVSLSLFVSVQFLEHARGRPLFSFPGGKGYDKDMTRQADKLEDWTAPVEVLLGILVRKTKVGLGRLAKGAAILNRKACLTRRLVEYMRSESFLWSLQFSLSCCRMR
jgi:Na+/proline symporter